MGKNTRGTTYDCEVLKDLVKQICRGREAIEGQKVSEDRMDLEGLEHAVKSLPGKERTALEKFFGLLPGTAKLIKLYTKKHKELAYKNLMIEAVNAINLLSTVEFMVIYDKSAKKLVCDVMKKIDKTGIETMASTSCIKYYLMFLIFFFNGPKMIYEFLGDEINPGIDEQHLFDGYNLLKSNWEAILKDIPDYTINLGLFIEIIQMFDYKDLIAMKKFMRLKISSKAEESFQEISIGTSFTEIRKFKEHLFPCGAWELTSNLIFNGRNCASAEDVERLWDFLCEFRWEWNRGDKYKIGTLEVPLSDGVKTLNIYAWQEFKCTDIYEFLSLYLCREQLL